MLVSYNFGMSYAEIDTQLSWLLKLSFSEYIILEKVTCTSICEWWSLLADVKGFVYCPLLCGSLSSGEIGSRAHALVNREKSQSTP